MTQEGNVNRQKICRVCSDKAMGFNFNAITCESCKAFFRRNAFKGEKLRCPFNNDCIIDKSTRRFCQKCRLEKCIQVGMKKEWILSEEQKKIKRAKIAENRMKRKVDDSTGDPKDELDDEPPTSSNNKNKRVYSKDGGPTTPSSSISISCSSSRCSSQFGEDNGTGSQFTYSLFPENPNGSSSPNDLSRKDSLVSCDADTESETMKLLTKVELKTMASNSQKRDSKNDTTIDSDLVKNTTMAERCNASPSDTACLLLDKDLHESWISLITDPSSSPNIITRISCPSANHDWDSHNSETLGYSDNVENMEYSSTETHRQTSSTLLLSLTTPVATTRPQLEPLHNNARGYDAREEFWRLKVNHRILEANFAPIYLRNNDKEISNVLNDLETAKINELVQAFSAIDEPILDNSCSQNPGISDIIRFSDLAIRRLIKWCKKINAFASLCLEDQMALLKAGCLEMLSMKASFNFNLDDESWQDTYTKYGLKLTIFRKASEKLYEAHRQFIRTFNQRWRTDHKVNLLLVAIVLFNPDRPNLLHPATVRLEHYTYIYLLRRYLESKSDSVCQARTDHYHLMLKIEDLRELHEKTLELYSEAGPEVVGPLLIEILDLK